MTSFAQKSWDKYILKVKAILENDLHCLLMEPELKILQDIVNSISDKHAQLTGGIKIFNYLGKNYFHNLSYSLHRPVIQTLHSSLVSEFHPHYLSNKEAQDKASFIVKVIMSIVSIHAVMDSYKVKVIGVPYELGKLLPENEWYIIPQPNNIDIPVLSEANKKNLKAIEPDIEYFLSLRVFL